jgi:hypothetical protein
MQPYPVLLHYYKWCGDGALPLAHGVTPRVYFVFSRVVYWQMDVQESTVLIFYDDVKRLLFFFALMSFLKYC